MPKQKSEDYLHALRHTAEHVLHQAMADLFPGLTRAMGPATDEGFYHDFDYEGKITEADFPRIEKRMREIIDADLPITRHEISITEARKLFKDNLYKQDWLDQIKAKGEKATVYWTGKPGEKGSDVDLCKGPHLASTGEVKAFKLLSVAGAYWHGDEKNKMLTRIYGTAFPSQKELDDYLKQREEAEKRDHRKIGKEQNLFVFTDLVGKGLPLFTPKGSVIRRELERYIVDEEIKRGYQHVYTPDLAKVALFEKSGHYPYYKDSMYPLMEVDDEKLILRPMTCPHHYELYASEPRSYRDLPFRLAELAKQFRFEKSGELTGLMRVRAFCLADSHIICRKNQAEAEINLVLDLIEDASSALGLTKGKDYRYRLSLGDRSDTKKYYKDDKAWDHAEDILRKILKSRKEPFFEAEGEAAFYGPKIDIQIKNVLGKEETAFTVQYDFVAPKRFDLDYINESGEKEEPIVIHRSSIGAIERVLAFLIEHYAGAFPVWLSPVQVKVIPITDQQLDYAKKIEKSLKGEGIRVELNDLSETTGAKIRKAESEKIPYMLILGGREEKAGTVNVRVRGERVLGEMSLDKFVKLVKEDIEKKRQI